MEQQTKRVGFSLKGSVAARLAVIGLLTLGLLIPLEMVSGVVGERQGRQTQAEMEVAQSWGQPQQIIGPVLSIPYERSWTDDKGQLYSVWETAYVLPSTLDVTGVVEPEVRNLGIFDVVVYRTRLKLKGTFEKPDSRLFRRATASPRWGEAVIALGIPDLRGIQSDASVTWNETAIPLLPGTEEVDFLPSGVHALLPDLSDLPASQKGTFEVELVLNGSRELRVAPVGRSTTVHLSSPWPDPAFIGAFLPAERTVTDAGFEARWNISYLGRGYPEGWRSVDDQDGTLQRAVQTSAVGVELLRLVDSYRKTKRSAKYSILFILVPFTTFFLFEILQPFMLHPLHYLLVGFSLCVFYLLLLSLSEFLPFGFAYAAASFATVGLIGGYATSILRGKSRGLTTAAVLGGLYFYLYTLLQLRDYALLLGSLGLFAILATVMWITRRVDWHGLRLGSAGSAGSNVAAS